MSGSFLLNVQELTRPSNVHSISVRWYTSIKDIKDQLKKVFNAPPSRISLFHSSVPKALKNQIRLHDLGIEKEGHILKVSIGVYSNKSFNLFPSKDIQVDQNCKDIISLARQGFERSQVPGKTDEFDCTGGVYFFKAASGEKIAVFKPNDEEQGMPNNPKGHAGDGNEGLRPYFQPGHGYIRETAAYLMDHKNFCQVPPTTIVHCEHSCFNYPKIQGESNESYPKVGSLQQFVYANDTFEDISPSLISCFELQKIAVLDIRLLNCDRNSSNILAIRRVPNYNTKCRRDSRSSSMGSFPDEGNCDEEIDFSFQEDDVHDFNSGNATPHERFELIPIDHGYCMPSKLKIDELDWIWFYCAQISCEVDPEIKKYVLSLNVEEMVTQLSEQLKLPEYNCFLLRLSHHVLVEGIKAGLTLFTIASLIARTTEDVPSFLEKVIKSAEENAYRTIEMRSNRLNSRGNSTKSFGSTSGSFHSPTRIRPFPSASSISRDISDNSGDTSVSAVDSLYGLNRKYSIDDTPDGFSSVKRHRVIHSAVNLEALGMSHELVNNTNEYATSKYMQFAQSLQNGTNANKSNLSSLSVENVEKLSSLLVPENSDDFYLAELSPELSPKVQQSSSSFEESEGISLDLSASNTLGGNKLVVMHSLDSGASSSRGSSRGNLSRNSNNSNNNSTKNSRFSCERLDEEKEFTENNKNNNNNISSTNSNTKISIASVVAVNSNINVPPPREVSAPIIIPTQGLSPESDSTSCEASSKEEDSSCSPRSFGDNFFLSGESLLYRSNVPFGRSNATEEIFRVGSSSTKERPFPPRISPVPTTELKQVKSNNNKKNNDLSPETSDEDVETDAEVQKLSLPRDHSQASLVCKVLQGNERTVTPTLTTSLQRVASFNAFESPAIYEEKQSQSRQMRMLYREQRKAVSLSPEFLELRLKFAKLAVHNFIEREFVKSSTKSKFELN